MVNDQKSILGLELPTDPRWVNLVQHKIEDILTDHAYCEQKAATFCISLIQQNPGRERLVEELAPIVTEEWGHFRLVLDELKKRNLKLGRQRKDEYVNKLRAFAKQGGSREDQLIEKLLTCALIEARSCERFRLLSLELEEPHLKKFYHRFMISEAGHFKLFLSLAEEYGNADHVKNRWQEYLQFEKEMLQKLEHRGDRIH